MFLLVLFRAVLNGVRVYYFLQEENLTSDLIFKKANSYPCLEKLARKIMCVPAISAPVERVFSQSDHLMRPNRSRFTKNNICILILLFFV